MKIPLFTLLVFLFGSLCVQAQNKNSAKTDSLLKQLKTCTSDTCTVNNLNKLAKEYLKNDDEKNAESSARKAYEESNQLNYKSGIAESINYLGKIDKRQGNYDQAMQKYEISLKLYEEIKDTVWISRNLNNIGEIYILWGIYEKAVDYYLKALKLKQISNDKKGEGITLNAIGQVFLRASKHEEAVQYFQKALKIFESTGNKDLTALTYNNLGVLYQNSAVGKDTTKFYKSLEYYNLALEILKNSNNKRDKADMINNIGNIYGGIGDVYNLESKREKNKERQKKLANLYISMIEKSIKYYKESLTIREDCGDKKGIAACYSNIGFAYTNLGEVTKESAYYVTAKPYLMDALELFKSLNIKTEVAISLYTISQYYFRQKQCDKAITYLDASLLASKEINEKNTIMKCYQMFTAIYDSTNNYKKALLYSQLYSDLKDTITNEASVKAIQEMQTKYETVKKETQITLLGSEKKLQEVQIRQQKIVIFAFLAGFLIILIFSIIIYKQFREKKKANILLAHQNEEIIQQKEEISAQRDEIGVQMQIAEKQRDYITEQKNEMDDSIRYAKRIQQAVLPQLENVGSHTKDMFIMFKPKDVVSGDFYYIRYIERSGVLIAAAADCTGHGVPGAFMSMLGVTFLNEICSKPEIQHASEVLDMLRQYIIGSLHQTGKFGEQKDGMDISLVAIFKDKKVMEFAGANNPLYLFRNKELQEFKGDKMPIGIHDRVNQPFTNQVIDIQENDCLYLFSDGFSDQFGGDRGKKYMSKKFKEFLMGIHEQPMADQHNLVETESISWRGKIEQIDDQLVVGIRI